MLLQQSVDECIEYKLRVVRVVAHLSYQRQMVAALDDVEVDGIQQHVVHRQRVYIALAVESFGPRRGHVQQQVLELDALPRLQHGGNGVLLLALHVQLHGGQQPADGRLVYGLLCHLFRYAVAQHLALAQQPVVGAAGIHLHDEVAALCPQDGGVGTCLQQQSNVGRPVHLGRVAQGEVVQQSADGMRQLQV